MHNTETVTEGAHSNARERNRRGMTTADLLLLLLAAVSSLSGCSASCGGKIEAGDSSIGTLQSPNFPSDYSIGQKCIWIINAPTNYAVRFTFTTLQMQAALGETCGDYVEIRGVSSTDTLLFKGCQQTSNTIVTTTNKFAWVKFYSNYQYVNKGFSVDWSIVYNGTNQASASRPKCKMTEFECPNGECTSTAYLCDNVTDCGCDSDRCDEGAFYCQPANIKMWEIYTIGGCLGVGIFLIVFFTCSFMESRYNHCPGYCAPQPHMKGPLKPHKEEEEEESFCKPCVCCCSSTKKEEPSTSDEKQQLEQSYTQIMHIMIDGPQTIDWYAESDVDSKVPSRQPSVTGDLEVLNVSYGKKLSPQNVPPQVKRVGGPPEKQTTVSV